MDMLNSSQIGSVIQSYMNSDFALISVLTFFLCEAIFNAFPVQQAKMKQLTSILSGIALSILMTKGAIPDALIRGILAGGATTISVAKFKKSSATAIAIATDTVTESDEPAASLTPAPEPIPEAVEHI